MIIQMRLATLCLGFLLWAGCGGGDGATESSASAPSDAGEPKVDMAEVAKALEGLPELIIVDGHVFYRYTRDGKRLPNRPIAFARVIRSAYDETESWFTSQNLQVGFAFRDIRGASSPIGPVDLTMTNTELATSLGFVEVSELRPVDSVTFMYSDHTVEDGLERSKARAGEVRAPESLHQSRRALAMMEDRYTAGERRMYGALGLETGAVYYWNGGLAKELWCEFIADIEPASEGAVAASQDEVKQLIGCEH